MKVQRTNSFSAVGDSDNDSNESLHDTADQDDELTTGFFKPLYTISIWKEPETMTRRVTLAIVLPSGIECGNFSLRVINGGGCLEVTVKWPTPLLDLSMMHKKWLTGVSSPYQVYHPEYIGFQESMKKLRCKSTDWIESMTRIPLPFTVETHIHDKHNLGWRDNSTKLLYVRLKAAVEQYAVHTDKEKFDLL